MRILSRAALRIDAIETPEEAALVAKYAAQLGFQAVMSPTEQGLAIELSRLDDFPPVNDIAALAVFQAAASGAQIPNVMSDARDWLSVNDVKEPN